jgi:hypothetical protein
MTRLAPNGGGIIHLPLVPVGGRLALGVEHAGGVVGCNLWPFVLTPGARNSVVDGRVAGWPEPRFVNDFGVPGLEEFVQTVDFLPNFIGDVIVSTAMLTGTFVPEPTSWLLLLGGALPIAGRHRTSRRA